MKKTLFAWISLIMINNVLASECIDSQNGSISSAKSPSTQGFNPNKLALVDAQIESDIAAGFPGAELIIIRNHQIVKHSLYGYAVRYNSQNQVLNNPLPLQCNTLFDLASNTKMYATNYAIMHLVYQGKLDINQPIHTYIPEYRGCDKNGQCRDTRLVRDLLTHSAGYMPDPQFFNPTNIAKYGHNLYSQESSLTKQIILTRLPFAKARNSQPVYSDVDFMLLGILVERVTGMSLDEYMANEFYQPLKLSHTTFNPLQHGFTTNSCAATELQGNTRGNTIYFPNIRSNVLQCQVHDEKAYYSMAGVSGHAGLFSDGADLAVLTELMTNNGKYDNLVFWNESVVEQFTQPLASDATYGLGWRRAGNNHNYAPFGHYASNLAYGHTGWTGTLTLIEPKYNLTIILLTNKKHSIYNNGEFAGDKFATGKYSHIVDLIYQALD